MTTSRGGALEAQATDLQVAENVVVLMRRSRVTQLALGTAVGISPQTMSRRLAGSQPWMLWEVQAIARFFDVSLTEITGDLPSRSAYLVRHEGLEPPTRWFDANRRSGRPDHLRVVV